MSFGFYAKNNNGQLMFSDSSYTLEYIGKATLRTDIGYNGFSLYYAQNAKDWRYYIYGGYTIYDLPMPYSIGYYDVEATASELVAFSYVPVNDVFTAIIYQKQLNATTTRFYVLTQGNTNISNDPFAPQVYCFKKITQKSDTGHGIKIYDANGNETFTTQANIAILKAGANMSVQASRMSAGKYSNLVYASNNNNVHALNVQDHALVSSAQYMAKPAISYYSPSSGIGYIGSGGVNRFFELGVRYNNISNVIQSQWAEVVSVYSGYNSTKNIAAHTSFAMMIDGADYD